MTASLTSDRMMANRSIKKSLFILLLLIFVHQEALASYQHCSSQPPQAGAVAAVQADAHHGHHPMSATAVEPVALDAQQTSPDCCETSDHCISGGCLLKSTVSALSFTPERQAAGHTRFYIASAPLSPISKLYRPPIFR